MNDLSVYVPALEWLTESDVTHNATAIFLGKAEFRFDRPDWESGKAVFLILQKLEEKAGFVQLTCERNEQGQRCCTCLVIEDMEVTKGNGNLITTAVLNAVLALYEGQKT